MIKVLLLLPLLLSYACNKSGSEKDIDDPGAAIEIMGEERIRVTNVCNALESFRTEVTSKNNGQQFPLNLQKNTCADPNIISIVDNVFYTLSNNEDIFFNSTVNLCNENKVVWTDKVEPMKTYCDNFANGNYINQVKLDLRLFTIGASNDKIGTAITFKQFAIDRQDNSKVSLTKLHQLSVVTDEQKTNYGQVNTYSLGIRCENSDTMSLCSQKL